MWINKGRHHAAHSFCNFIETGILFISMKEKKIVDPRFAKGRGEYENVINTIKETGKCPFCPNNFKYHKHPTLKKRGDWFITKISWPYKNHKCHFIIIKKSHVEDISELKAKDMENILFLSKWAVKEFKLKGGGLCMRFGDTNFTGSTVCHIHAHLITPIRDKTVNFPIG